MSDKVFLVTVSIVVLGFGACYMPAGFATGELSSLATSGYDWVAGGSLFDPDSEDIWDDEDELKSLEELGYELSDEANFMLVEDGDGRIVIRSDHGNGEMSLSSPRFDPPIERPNRESIKLEFWYRALDEQPHQGEVTITLNDEYNEPVYEVEYAFTKNTLKLRAPDVADFDELVLEEDVNLAYGDDSPWVKIRVRFTGGSTSEMELEYVPEDEDAYLSADKEFAEPEATSNTTIASYSVTHDSKPDEDFELTELTVEYLQE